MSEHRVRHEAVRGHLCLALDVDDLEEATRLAADLRDHFSVVKVGLQLFTSEGPGAVGALREGGFDVFLDVKLHDIPNTVGRAARNGASAGARYLTVHAAGGAEMLRRAVDGAAEGSNGRCGILAVTVLTSEPAASASVLHARAATAAEAGCEGVVCAGADLRVVASAAPGLLRVVPGIRLSSAPADDQKRTATPAEAISKGADLLVVGRTVTGGGAGRERLEQLCGDVTRALAAG